MSGSASASPSIGPVTVQLRTAAGAPVTSGITVSLSSSSTGGNEFSASNGGADVTSVVIPAGSSSVRFYYGDELAGTPTLTVSAAGGHLRHPGGDDQRRDRGPAELHRGDHREPQEDQE